MRSSNYKIKEKINDVSKTAEQNQRMDIQICI